MAEPDNNAAGLIAKPWAIGIRGYLPPLLNRQGQLSLEYDKTTTRTVPFRRGE